MSNLIVSGLNYNFASLSIREQFSIPKSCVNYALEALKQSPNISEAVLLSTCNRTEVYAVAENVNKGFGDLTKFFNMVQTVSGHSALDPEFKLIREDVVLHLLRVASGLDSMVLGEGQIMSQLKDAHQAALQVKACGRDLDYVFKLALECGKQVRSSTNLAKGAVSVASVAVELAREQFKDLNNKNILIIGAGAMAQTCLKLLYSATKNTKIQLINRNRENAEKLVASFNLLAHNVTVADFEDRDNLAANADLVIMATGASQYLLNAKIWLEKKLNSIKKAKQIFIDLSVPRNIDPDLKQVAGISLYFIDDLVSIVDKNLASREELIAQVELIIACYMKEFINWQLTKAIIPTITKLKIKMEEKRIKEIKKIKAIALQTHSIDSVNMNEQITKSLINTILHEPITHLKSITSHESLIQETSSLCRLFSLDSLNRKP